MRASLGFLGAAMIVGMTVRSVQGIVTWGTSSPLDYFLVALRTSLLISTVFALVGWVGFVGVLACRHLLRKPMIPGGALTLSGIAAVAPSLLGHGGVFTSGAILLQERGNILLSGFVVVMTMQVVAAAISTTVTFSLAQRYQAGVRATNG